MKVKVYCTCGSKFEFEVEPLNGRMPVAIACPACGADATGLANAVIAEQLAAAPPVPPPAATPVKARLHVAGAGAPAVNPPPSANPPPPAPPASSGLRISKAAPAAAAAPAPEASEETPPADAVQSCYRHKKMPAVDNCYVCGKPICETCREQFGHVCSRTCREAAANQGVQIPAYANQRELMDARAEQRVKNVALAIVGAITLVFGTWAWYTYWARQPHVVYSFKYPKTGSYDTVHELIAPDRLLSLKGRQLTLLDVAKDAPVWSVALPEDTSASADAFEDYLDDAGPQLITTTNDIWVALAGNVFRIDRANGTRKDLSLPDNIRQVVTDNGAILVVSGKPKTTAQVTRISLPDGAVQTEDASPMSIAVPARSPLTNAPARAAARPPVARGDPSSPASTISQVRGFAAATTANATARANAAGDDAAPRPAQPATAAFQDATDERFVPASEGAVQFGSKLLEQRTVTHQAMKKRGASVLDDQNLTASRSTDLAEEMMNDQRRDETGGVEIEDVSRYQVTLHRMFEKGVPDWTGEVIGPPRFVSLKSVDLLVAGTNLTVFDKSNKKLWSTTLTFLPRERESFRGLDDLPVLETRDALYFADKGVLTRFDLLTGNVRWRLTTVGVSAITMNDRGELYVDTSTATAESIRYSQQVNLHSSVEQVIMRVDPESGKMLWNTHFDSTSYRAVPSGKFLYSTREWQTQDPLRLEDGPDNNVNIKLLKADTGDPIWTYPVVGKSLVKAEVQQNWVLLQFADEVRVLKFFSF